MLQVVAGTNYKLLLDIANSQNQKERLEAVVYGESCSLLQCNVSDQKEAVSAKLTVYDVRCYLQHGECCLSVNICAEPLGGQEMKLTSHRTPSPDEVRLTASSATTYPAALTLLLSIAVCSGISGALECSKVGHLVLIWLLA